MFRPTLIVPYRTVPSNVWIKAYLVSKGVQPYRFAVELIFSETFSALAQATDPNLEERNNICLVVAVMGCTTSTCSSSTVKSIDPLSCKGDDYMYK